MGTQTLISAQRPYLRLRVLSIAVGICSSLKLFVDNIAAAISPQDTEKGFSVSNPLTKSWYSQIQ
ncbi:hypothetical protein R7P07_01085 [Vibrio sp. Vb2133]|nr:MULTISPECIES: hypothetical protein [Vibrio]ELP3325719.1 hypothetical protein [Vibrio alginolyticus]KZC45319.1 putative secreted protein [Vibrio alginolyticus]MBS9913250.1 hypothetical protein [Vibrio alginolyticus]MDW1746910.1 hypothetical protein [Vibrio sp. Vb2133]MDW1790158.1 hypothetical protein [Vibrio sp. Vb2132]